MLWPDQNTLNMSRFCTANDTPRLFRLHRFASRCGLKQTKDTGSSAETSQDGLRDAPAAL